MKGYVFLEPIYIGLWRYKFGQREQIYGLNAVLNVTIKTNILALCNERQVRTMK